MAVTINEAKRLVFLKIAKNRCKYEASITYGILFPPFFTGFVLVESLILRHPDVASIKTAPPKVEEGKRYEDVDGVFDDPNDVYYVPQTPQSKGVYTLSLVCWVWVGWFEDTGNQQNTTQTVWSFLKLSEA